MRKASSDVCFDIFLPREESFGLRVLSVGKGMSVMSFGLGLFYGDSYVIQHQKWLETCRDNI